MAPRKKARRTTQQLLHESEERKIERLKEAHAVLRASLKAMTASETDRDLRMQALEALALMYPADFARLLETACQHRAVARAALMAAGG